MNPLLIRRRGMMAAQWVPLTLLYSNANVTSSVNTGVKLFDPAISFTILVDCSCNHYNWTSAQGVIGMSTNGRQFRVGRVSSADDYSNGNLSGASVNRFFAISLNQYGGIKCTSLLPRGNNEVTRKKFGVSFDVNTLKMQGARSGSTSGVYWYNLDAAPSNTYTVQLWVGSGSGTIHDVQIYQGVMPLQQMLDYVNA